MHSIDADQQDVRDLAPTLILRCSGRIRQVWQQERGGKNSSLPLIIYQPNPPEDKIVLNKAFHGTAL